MLDLVKVYAEMEERRMDNLLSHRERTMQTLADYQNHPRFALLRETVEKAGSDATWMFGGTHDGGYYIQQNPDEFAALLCLLLNRCRPINLYGEIGVAAGGTTRLIHVTLGFNHAILIDDGRHPKHRHTADNLKSLTFDMMIGDSHGAEVKADLANVMGKWIGFDVVFIDGDHSYEGVVQDIELVKPYCSPATLLIFHDTVCCPGVKQMWAEMPAERKVAEFVGTDKQLGIGVARAG